MPDYYDDGIEPPPSCWPDYDPWPEQEARIEKTQLEWARRSITLIPPTPMVWSEPVSDEENMAAAFNYMKNMYGPGSAWYEEHFFNNLREHKGGDYEPYDE